MKNKLIILTGFIFFIIIIFFVEMEGIEDLDNSVSIKNIKTIDENKIKYIKRNRQESKYDLISLEYNKSKIPYDKKNNKYYISKYDKGYDIDIYYNDSTIIRYILSKDKNSIRLIAYNKNKYKVYNVCLSKFPIVSINANNKKNTKELITDKYIYGDINIFDNKTYKNKLNIINESAKFKTRGIASLNFEKKSYTIQFIDSKNGKEKIVNDFLGLERNNKFALNSLYEDESKIRDILSLNTWENISKNNSNKIKMEYVEVFINNEYYGLYGFSEIINEHKLKVENSNSIIYKINDDIVPSLDIFDTKNKKIYTKENTNTNIMEIVYPNNTYYGIWEPLSNLTEIIYYYNDNKFENNILKYIDIDNIVDYFILQELTYDVDGIWKNGVFTYSQNTKKLIRTPWDLDFTFGKHWDENNKLIFSKNDMEFSKKLLFKNGNNQQKTYLEQRLWQNNVGNFRQKVAKRWKELRSGFLETESFVNYANSLYDEVTESGAREREHERWPDGGYSTDNSFIEKFIRQRLPYLDSQFLQYLDDSGEN